MRARHPDDTGADGFGIIAFMSKAALRYADFVIRWRWPVLVLSILAAIAVMSEARNLVLSTSYRAFFDPENPQLVAHDALESTYVKVD